MDQVPITGKRHLTGKVRAEREQAQKAKDYRREFLRNLKPEHPLYAPREARAARGEPVVLLPVLWTGLS